MVVVLILAEVVVAVAATSYGSNQNGSSKVDMGAAVTAIIVRVVTTQSPSVG